MKHFKIIFRFLLSALVHPNLRNVLSLLLMEIQSPQSFKEKKTQKQYHILREFIFFFLIHLWEKQSKKHHLHPLKYYSWVKSHMNSLSVCRSCGWLGNKLSWKVTQHRCLPWLRDNKSWKVPSVHSDKCYFCFWLPRNNWYTFSIACWNLE